MDKESTEKVLGQLPWEDRFLLRLGKYMPYRIQTRILQKVLPTIISEAVLHAVKEFRKEVGNEAFQEMLNQLPTKIRDKGGVWILPSGTTREEVAEFLIQLKEKDASKC